MLTCRTYGDSGPPVIVIHGGPGAPGGMAPVARGLAGEFRVVEPFQRGSGNEPLTVQRHVADLHEVIGLFDGDTPPALVGSSWGAMLALAYAAAHPRTAGPVVLAGCGTFDVTSRTRLHETLEQRLDDSLRRRLLEIDREVLDPDERLRVKARLILPLYSVDEVEAEDDESVDARAHDETWRDMLRLQENGTYPDSFSCIQSPVLMLHGAFDPHPGRLICACLRRHIPQLEYHEWEACGHYPWREKAVRDDFFRLLCSWLRKKLARV